MFPLHHQPSLIRQSTTSINSVVTFDSRLSNRSGYINPVSNVAGSSETVAFTRQPAATALGAATALVATPDHTSILRRKNGLSPQISVVSAGGGYGGGGGSSPRQQLCRAPPAAAAEGLTKLSEAGSQRNLGGPAAELKTQLSMANTDASFTQDEIYR